MLEIKNLHAKVEEKDILKGVNLEIKSGEIHAIMGPNGSGKSTLASVITGKEEYEMTEGQIVFENENLEDVSAEDRAHKGIFMSFQYPVSIPGLNTMHFLRTSVNSIRKHQNKKEYTSCVNKQINKYIHQYNIK